MTGTPCGVFEGERDLGWYVNFEAPVVRGVDCFDTLDYGLDIVVGTDRTWEWKDVDDPDRLVEEGRVSRELVEVLRGKAAEVAEALDEGRRWWAGWDDWRPPLP
jgi:protein associated with RNAse G/E